MYKGIKHADEATRGAASDQLEKEGPNPIRPLSDATGQTLIGISE
jgi:hypothetical protein